MKNYDVYFIILQYYSETVELFFIYCKSIKYCDINCDYDKVLENINSKSYLDKENNIKHFKNSIILSLIV